MESFKFFMYRSRHLKGVGNAGLLKLLSAYYQGGWLNVTPDDMGVLLKLSLKQKNTLQASWQEFQRHQHDHYQQFHQQKMLTFLDDEYPEHLKEIYNPPAILFYRGDISLIKKPSLAIVGSRAATNYGLSVTSQLVPDLVKAGLITISGLARGIDTCVHQQTIRHHGQTIGVIGTSLDYVYPAENQRLQEYLARHHLLISEYLPSTGPMPYHFPARNRIIAGLSLGTLIIEAKARSGSLITAQLALESGREVFAVPGNVLTPYSDGALELIQTGAKCVKNSQHILEELPDFFIQKT